MIYTVHPPLPRKNHWNNWPISLKTHTQNTQKKNKTGPILRNNWYIHWGGNKIHFSRWTPSKYAHLYTDKFICLVYRTKLVLALLWGQRPYIWSTCQLRCFSSKHRLIPKTILRQVGVGVNRVICQNQVASIFYRVLSSESIIQ